MANHHPDYKIVLSDTSKKNIQRIADVCNAFYRQVEPITKEFNKTIQPILEQLSHPGVIEALKQGTLRFGTIHHLKGYKWGLTPYLKRSHFDKMLMDNRLLKLSQIELDTLFIEYFLENNCFHLEQMVNQWFENPLFECRRESLTGALEAVKAIVEKHPLNESSKIAAYAVTHVLISNIEGVCRDFATELGLIPPHVSSNFKRNPQDKRGIPFWSLFWELPGSYDSIAWLEFFDMDLFANALLSTDNNPLTAQEGNFNWHRIKHGNEKEYGKDPANMIRLFLCLDFLSGYQYSDNYAEYLELSHNRTSPE